MKFNWLLNVLADMKAFAQNNGLDTLADQLDDTTKRTLDEIEAEQASTPRPIPANDVARNVHPLPSRSKVSR